MYELCTESLFGLVCHRSCSLMSLCSVLFQHTIVVSVAFSAGSHAVLMIKIHDLSSLCCSETVATIAWAVVLDSETVQTDGIVATRIVILQHLLGQ